MKYIEFACQSYSDIVCISKEVLQTFKNYQQDKFYKRESGGHLFAKFYDDRACIEYASVPHRFDIRLRTRFTLSGKRRNEIISQMYKKGLHYIGDWHTHPEPYPSYSKIDILSMRKLYCESTQQLNNFLMIIVGNGTITKAIRAWVINDNHSESLRLITS